MTGLSRNATSSIFKPYIECLPDIFHLLNQYGIYFGVYTLSYKHIQEGDNVIKHPVLIVFDNGSYWHALYIVHAWGVLLQLGKLFDKVCYLWYDHYWSRDPIPPSRVELMCPEMLNFHPFLSWQNITFVRNIKQHLLHWISTM